MKTTVVSNRPHRSVAKRTAARAPLAAENQVDAALKLADLTAGALLQQQALRTRE